MENKEEKEIKEETTNDEFGGTFHERDSHAENDIVKEISDSFLDYSMSVITSRAIPDLRDGLKPVHRRILWSMFEEGNTPDKPHKKSATTVGYVMGHYHPHGDSSIYEAMVRLAQDFNQRYMMVDGHGNFGNIEGDGAAAYRYTEARLSKISLEMLRDIRKNTVDMDDNFDETCKEPKVLPSRFPNVLVNGSMGIAVGMATNIPPHNLGEVIDGCVAYIDNPDIDVNGLMNYIKGPDFPTGGIILGNSGIKKAYETGRGSITIRSRASIEEVGNHSQIVITEVPYGTNTLDLKNKVAELVHNKTIEGISDYHTDLKNGVKITITLKRDANPQVVLNNLFKHTNFQINYGIIFLVIDNGTPRTLGLKDIISKYIDHQKEVIIRRTKYELNEDEKRVHILEGLKIALDNIDEVVKIIRGADDDQDAKEKLMTKFGLDEIQSNSILEMRLRRLTGLERDKIENELYTTKEEVAKDYNVSFIIPKYEEYVYLPNGKIDLTQEEIFTIDNEGDMCLDDAMSIKRNDNGTYTLFIHLANPTATIPYESNTMHEALKRNHTIYLSNNSIPIFDRYLSDNILSILPNKNTNALTIKVGVTPDYSLDLDTLEIIPSIIKNKHKLTYQGAEEIITSTGLLHDDLILISKIFDKQAIDNPRVRAYHHMKERINNQKEVDSEAPIAHMMVEQCNVFANSTIHLIDKREHLGLIMPWRVQREENIELIEKYLEHGSFDINSSGLQLLLKNYMTKSKYSYTNIGHQGLGIDGYVKISSAARRAMDALAVYVLYDLYINRSTDDLDSKYYYWEKEIKYWCEYANNKASDNITFMEQYNYLSSKGKILERRK